MAKSHEQFVSELEIINPSIEVTGKYTRAVDPVEVKCKRCGRIWSPRAYSLTQGKACPHCSAIKGSKNNRGKTGVKSFDVYQKELAEINPRIDVSGYYQNNKSLIHCICKRCGHEWDARAYSLLQGHGCPRCAKSGTSFMEQFIYESLKAVLGEQSVLSRDRKTIGKELDIIIPERSIAFEPGNWFLHEKRIEKDRTKRELCKEKGIRLITIYDNYPEHKLPPFETDCIVFSGDYNTDDHKHIKKLVIELLDIIGVAINLDDIGWEHIEMRAYMNSLSRTHDDFVKNLKSINPDITVLGEYKNTNKRLTVKCNTCGFTWEAVPANLLAGDGCRKCGTIKAHQRLLKAQDVFVKQISLVNPEIEITGVYTGRHSPVKARCKVCGYEWEPIASSLLRGSSHKGAKSKHHSNQ